MRSFYYLCGKNIMKTVLMTENETKISLYLRVWSIMSTPYHRLQVGGQFHVLIIFAPKLNVSLLL
jgi:hypothetical protein